MRNRSFTYSYITNNFDFISNSALFDFNPNDIKRIRREFNQLFTNIELLNQQKQRQHHELQQKHQKFHQQQHQQQLQQHQKLQQHHKHHYSLA